MGKGPDGLGSHGQPHCPARKTLLATETKPAVLNHKATYLLIAKVVLSSTLIMLAKMTTYVSFPAAFKKHELAAP